jgi:hypothetical protein
MTAPHISGFVAYLLSRFFKRVGRRPTESELYTVVKVLTIDIDAAGVDNKTGAGFISVMPV